MALLPLGCPQGQNLVKILNLNNEAITNTCRSLQQKLFERRHVVVRSSVLTHGVHIFKCTVLGIPALFSLDLRLCLRLDSLAAKVGRPLVRTDDSQIMSTVAFSID